MCQGYHHSKASGFGHHGDHEHHEGDCGCSSHHGWGYGHGCGCGHHTHYHHRHGPCGCQHSDLCCCPEKYGPGFHRRFRSRAERIAELEEYLRELEAEAQGVREALEALRATSPSAQP